MRILTVCPYSLDVPGGVATHALGLSQWLAQQGHKVRILVPGRSAPDITPVEVRLVGAATGFRFNGSVARLAIWPRQLRAACQELEWADVVHVHEPLTPGLAFKLAREAKALVVTHHANFNVPVPLRVLLRARARKLGLRTSIAVSEAAANTAYAATGVRCQLIPNGITIPPVVPRGRNEKMRVLFVGRRDEPRKGFETFRAVAKLAAQRGLAAEFLVVGPGSSDPSPAIELGVLTDAELAAELASCDVLLAPNRYGESFGMILVEALAAGATVLASELTAFYKLLGSTRAARWFPVADVEACYIELLKLVADPVSRELAHATAQSWSWHQIGPQVEKLLVREGA